MLGGLLLLGYQIDPLFHLSAALHTHVQMRNKVYFGRPRLHTVLITSFSSSRGLADSRTPRPSAGIFLRQRKSSWWFCACVELVRPHSSAAEYTLNAARMRLCARRNGAECGSKEAFRLLLLIGNDLKTKPTSKLNCRVIIFIYKLGYVKSAKRDIFLNSFELWMNMTKVHRQHFVFFTGH